MAFGGTLTKKAFSPNVINFMNDTNLRPGDECEEPLPCTWHTRIENIVYHSRDWASPGTVPEIEGATSRWCFNKINEIPGLGPINIFHDLWNKPRI